MIEFLVELMSQAGFASAGRCRAGLKPNLLPIATQAALAMPSRSTPCRSRYPR
jgi:hypothetical protein